MLKVDAGLFLNPLKETRWRTGAAIAWVMIILPCTVFISSAAASIDLFHPVNWISGMHLSSDKPWPVNQMKIKITVADHFIDGFHKMFNRNKAKCFIFFCFLSSSKTNTSKY